MAVTSSTCTRTCAASDGSTAKEEITYNGTAGYYYWRVTAFSGGGTYTFAYTRRS